MYELTNETVAGRKYYAKLELDDGTVLTNYGDDAVGITSISISQTLCGSESISIGCVNAACATIVLEAGTALENQRFTLYMGQEFDGAVEWVPMGIFIGTKAEVSEDKLTVEAWDDLYFAGGTYTPDGSVTGTCAFYEALADVCDKLEWGFHGNAAAQTVNGVDVSGLTIAGMPAGLTYAAAIGYLAALLGANACMDREGCLVFRQFEESGQALGTDDCYSGGMVFKTSDFTVASLTNTLEVETTGDDGETTTETAEVERTTGAAGGSIALTNPLMTEDNIDTAWDVVKGFTYRPATLTAVGQLAVDVGDVLRVPTLTGGRNLLLGTRDFSGNVYATYITEDTYRGLTIVYYDNTDAKTSSYLNLCRWTSAITPEPDTYYTLSFWAKGTGEIRSFFFPNTVVSGENDSGNTTVSADGDIGTTLNENWTRHWITWKTSTDVSGAKSVLPARLFGGNECCICGVKLEQGNTPTDWTPAPEDTDESIYLVPVMTHSLEYDGGLKSTITAAGESESQQSAAVSGPVAQQIKELTTKVTDAKVLASGKNAVYYAAAAPSADDYTLSVNDLWFDTSGGDYAMYYWDGSKWVAAPFGTSALGDGIITAAKIVAGAVTAEKLNVSELSAIAANLGTVTAGDISGSTITGSVFKTEDLINCGTVEISDGQLKITGIERYDAGVINSSSGKKLGVYSKSGGDLLFTTEGCEEQDSSPNGLVSIGANCITCCGLDSTDFWFLIDNRDKTVDIIGALDVTGDATVNGFRVPEIQRGTVSITCTAGGTTSQEIAFDQAFSGTPSVLTNPLTSAPGNRQTSAKDASSTGFTLYLYSTASGTVTVDWVAIY